jgi:site-specific DNA-methyltransferase (adenine-specific)
MSARVEHLAEGVSLYLGDARVIAPSMGKVDALVSDPPYGQRQNTNVVGAAGLRTCRRGSVGGGERVIDGNALVRRTAKGIHSTRVATRFPDAIQGDDAPFDPALWLSIAPRVLLWGAHRFADRLPAGTWLVWDKVPTGKVRDQGDGEAAWLNDSPPRPMRIYRLLWDGVCVGAAARSEVTAGQARSHPTQKPVAVMDWCIEQVGIRSGRVLDPYMGTGATGVAAVKRGLGFIGVEIERQYFDIACRRVSAALAQPDIFIERPAHAKQEALPW